MSITLASLVTRLQAAVPARNSVPATGDYTQHVKDAVLQLSQDLPLRRTATLNVVAGIASYDLPADFLSIIEVSSLSNPTGILVTAAGLVPVPAEFDERYYVEGAHLVFEPVPTYTLSRTIRYAASHELVDDGYATLTGNGARVALLYAQYLALTQQANAVAGDGWSYQIGDERVDKSRQGQGLRDQADGVLKQYESVVKSQQGYGTRARHSVVGVAY